MKVAVVNQHMDDVVGGSEIQCEYIACGLSERGHDVAYIAPTSQEGWVGRQEFGYELMPVERRAKSISQALMGWEPDVIYWRFNKHHLLPVAKAAHRMRVPFVFAVAHINDIRPWSAKPSPRPLIGPVANAARRVRGRWHHRALRSIEVMTTNNPDYVEELPARIRRFVPNAVRVAPIAPFTWPRRYCVWIANIKASKRPEAVAALARELEGSDIDVLMVGKIQQREYQWLLDDAARPSNLHYLGLRDLEDVRGIIASSDLLVHTFEPEGFSNVLIQAWALGRPTVSLEFDPGGYIEDFGLGACAGGDWDRFVTQVSDMLKRDDERQRIGSLAKAIAETHFSLERMVVRVEEVLNEAIECPLRAGSSQ